MTPEDFEKSKEFRALTKIQQEWVVSYVETGDAEGATRRAYPRAKNLRALRWQSEANPKIIAALELWEGKSLRESAIAGLQRDIRRSRGVARAEFKKLLFRLQGLIK